MFESLVDRIHEVSFAPELWPDVLDDLAQLAEARGGALYASNAKGLRWTASPGLHDLVSAYASGGWAARGQRRSRLFGARHAGFLTEHDLYTAEELERDPIYADFLRPRGFGWGAAAAMPMPTGDRIIIGLERDYARGPVERRLLDRLDLLRPHLARSALVAARLQLERARAASEALALIGLPALVLDARGRVLVTNHLVETLSSFLTWRANDGFAFKDARADGLFRQALDALDLDTVAAPRSFVGRGAEGGQMVAHIVPIRRSARDIFIRCAALLLLTPVTPPRAPPEEMLQSLFDLTPAEARVARGLAAGDALEDLAVSGGVSRNTVRSQLRAVMDKTGCNRQAELVALFTGIMTPRG